MIWVYDIPAKKMNTYSLQIDKFDQESILIQKIIYIVGGITSMSNGAVSGCFAETYAFHLDKTGEGLKGLAPMKGKVCMNTICTTNDLVIYSVGGKSDTSYHNTCEKYTISSNTWTQIKNLNKARANIGLGIYDCKTIYAFGGFSGDFHTTIEALDTSSDANAWNEIAIANVAFFSPRLGMAVIQHPQTGLFMLFGGCSGIGITSDIFTFDIATRKIDRPKFKLLKSAAFIQRKPLLYKNNFYLPEYGRKCGMYIYSFIKNELVRLKHKDPTYMGMDLWNKKIKNP
jgi:hypothetical protein